MDKFEHAFSLDHQMSPAGKGTRLGTDGSMHGGEGGSYTVRSKVS